MYNKYVTHLAGERILAHLIEHALAIERRRKVHASLASEEPATRHRQRLDQAAVDHSDHLDRVVGEPKQVPEGKGRMDGKEEKKKRRACIRS